MRGSRVVRARKSHHRLSISTDNGMDLDLVKGRRDAYIWIGHPDNGAYFTSVSGAACLRRLAEAILKEVPKPKRRATHAAGARA